MAPSADDPATTHWWLAAALEALDEHVYFGLLLADGAYEELFAGPNLDGMLGGAPRSAADWRSRIAAEDLEAYYACEALIRDGQPTQVDYRVHGLDGKTRWIRARVRPEQLVDGTVRFAGILCDITEQREADDRLQAALTELADANARLDAARGQAVELAKTDALTGAANRRHVDEVLSDMLEVDGPPVGLLLLDIDDFKTVNDRHGHRVGDEVLIEMVGRLERALRPEDTVARWGGEEFLLLCRAETHEDLHVIAERVRAAVSEQSFPTTVGELSITISVGAVASRGSTERANPLVDAADGALLAAKRAGKNRTVIARAPRDPRLAA